MSVELDAERVKTAFALYSGEDLSQEGGRALLCARLCKESVLRAESLLKDCPAEKAERYLPALESWAAAEAFYHLALTDEAGTPERVSADGVEIVEGGRAQKARALAEEKRRAVLPVLGEEAFYFGRA